MKPIGIVACAVLWVATVAIAAGVVNRVGPQARQSVTRVVAERQHAIDCAVQGRPVDACCRPCDCASTSEAR
jgi:hypothetical protein